MVPPTHKESFSTQRGAVPSQFPICLLSFQAEGLSWEWGTAIAKSLISSMASHKIPSGELLVVARGNREPGIRGGKSELPPDIRAGLGWHSPPKEAGMGPRRKEILECVQLPQVVADHRRETEDRVVEVSMTRPHSVPGSHALVRKGLGLLNCDGSAEGSEGRHKPSSGRHRQGRCWVWRGGGSTYPI